MSNIVNMNLAVFAARLILSRRVVTPWKLHSDEAN